MQELVRMMALGVVQRPCAQEVRSYICMYGNIIRIITYLCML